MKWMLFLLIIFSVVTNTFAAQYSENNHGYASFDISMPIDATGYTLHGKHLKGGNIQFADYGVLVSDLLAHETGDFELPVSITPNSKPLIKTAIHYSAIKFINPSGINNLFIKIGTATRTQTVSELDPYVLKNGTYTWQVPIFSAGTESDDVNQRAENMQFMQVGTGKGPAQHNSMYTQQFYLYLQGKGNTGIAAHPEKTAAFGLLKKSYATQFTCHADGVWGAGGSDPYRTLTGHCNGSATTFPAGPNLDYEYGTFQLPTVHTPWNGTPADHCLVNGKPHAGCVNATIKSNFHYMAQKIRVPTNQNVTVYAEFGTAYRSIMPDNLRYECQNNVYLKNLLPPSDCLKKNYLPGSVAYPYFAVGYELQTKNGAHYVARYIYIPEQENANRLAWRDASATEIYAISGSQYESADVVRENLNDAINVIRSVPAVYDVLGKQFFDEILKKNNQHKKPNVLKLSLQASKST